VTWVTGTSPSPEHREKLSLALRGKKKSPTHRANIASAKQREKNPRWTGGRRVDKLGYVYLWVGKEHPLSQKSGYVLEHRLVMSGVIGRPLTADETVHHIDGNRENNQPDNLQLRKGRHGKGVSFMCGDCGSINVLALEL
jgi:hypothetical protein